VQSLATPVVDRAASLRENLPLQGERDNGSLVQRWFERLEPEQSFSVLDLAGAGAETVQSFGDYRCRIYCADFLTDLCLPAGNDLEFAARLFEDRLAFIGDGVIDYCLLWDYPHYLTAPQLTVFARCLQRYLHVGTSMHLYAAMNGRSRIDPWRYGVISPDTVIRRPVRRPIPDYPHTQTEVVDAMEYVRLERGALRDGRVEVLLECV
jgi:hypothetical protein